MVRPAIFTNASRMKARRSNRERSRLKGDCHVERGNLVRARDEMKRERDDISLSWLPLAGRNHPLRGALVLLV
ncbi:hypothetical protein SAMN04515620_102129 [Collimonas sp. OK607]|nr:hypothetical protein SAMN04515620_102129 [Collimonas sp. OK607]